MDENKSSQESLIFSQETYLNLFKELDGSLSRIMTDDLEAPLMSDQACDTLVNGFYNNNVNHQPEEISVMTQSEVNGYYNNNVDQLQGEDKDKTQSKLDLSSIKWENVDIPGHQYMGYETILEQKRPISSLPASENWPGIYSFSISFNPQTAKKGVSWIFSKEKNKLYVGKGVPCPVNFATNSSIEDKVFIRAMALFSSSDDASEKVTRCINHSIEELNKNIFEAEHFIRCEGQNVLYENDPVTGRQSVIVPYENPPAGQVYSTYLFKFMCFGSCSGGPNRRPLMIVFTLENKGKVIGRQKIDLKVCACPARDFNNDKKPQEQVLKEKKCLKRPIADHSFLPIPPKRTKESLEENHYCIKTRDKDCYIFLKKMKRLYTIYTNVTERFPSISQLIYSSSQSSSEDNDGENICN